MSRFAMPRLAVTAKLLSLRAGETTTVYTSLCWTTGTVVTSGRTGLTLNVNGVEKTIARRDILTFPGCTQAELAADDAAARAAITA